MKFATIKNLFFIISISLTFYTGNINAQKAPPMEIMAVVLSKTCPLPNSPDLQMNSPESIVKSAEDLSCPQQGDLQLVQAAITNLSNKPQQIGFEFDIKINEKSSTKKNLR